LKRGALRRESEAARGKVKGRGVGNKKRKDSTATGYFVI